MTILVVALKNRENNLVVLPSFDDSYLQARVGDQLFIAKDILLDRVYIMNGKVVQEPVETAPIIPQDSFYTFLGSYHDYLIVTYANSPAIEIFRVSENLVDPALELKLDIGASVCEGCVGLEQVKIEGGKVLYAYGASDQGSPTFYNIIDLTKDPLISEQITEEEWTILEDN